MLPRRVGLTGGIGSGKSTVAARLAELGAVVIDADAIAHEVVAVGSEGLAAVVARFDADVLRADGCLDRAKLGAIVFGDAAQLAALNAIVHPLVRERAGALEAAATAAVVVHDTPLLVENKLQEGFDDVIVVEAPVAVRLERLRGRGMDAEVAEQRISNQASDAQRRSVATAVLDNSGDLASLMRQVDALWIGLSGDGFGRPEQID